MAVKNCTYPPVEKNKTQNQHKWQRGTIEKPEKVVGIATKTNASAPLYAASTSADIAKAAEKTTIVKPGVAHNSPYVAKEYSIPTAATETAGAIAIALNESNPPVSYSDDVATACSATD